MATTKIVLDLQSDKILSNPTITAPSGITAQYIEYGATTVDAELGTLASDLSTETSLRTSADASLEAEISAINVSDFNRVVASQENTYYWSLSSKLLDGSEFIYLNGLLQMPNDDYATDLDGDGYVIGVTFTYDPESGRVQAAGQVVA